MPFDNSTNRGRVQKIIDLLELIAGSAESNQATEEELIVMLQPVFDKIGNPSPAAEQVVQTTVNTKELTAGQRAVFHLTEHASMRDLICALLGRLEAQQVQLKN